MSDNKFQLESKDARNIASQMDLIINRALINFFQAEYKILFSSPDVLKDVIIPMLLPSASNCSPQEGFLKSFSVYCEKQFHKDYVLDGLKPKDVFFAYRNYNGNSKNKQHAIKCYSVIEKNMQKYAAILGKAVGQSFNVIGDLTTLILPFADENSSKAAYQMVISKNSKAVDVYADYKQMQRDFMYVRHVRNAFQHGAFDTFQGLQKEWKYKGEQLSWPDRKQVVSNIIRALDCGNQLAMNKVQAELQKVEEYYNRKLISIKEILSNHSSLLAGDIIDAARKMDAGPYIVKNQACLFVTDDLLKAVIKLASDSNNNEQKVSLLEIAKEQELPVEKVENFLKQCLVPVQGGYAYTTLNQSNAIVAICKKAYQPVASDSHYRHSVVKSLNLLTEYNGGSIEGDMLSELIETHVILIDSSVFENVYGLAYLKRLFLPQVQQQILSRHNPTIIISRTTRYQLMQDYKAYENGDAADTKHKGYYVMQDDFLKSGVAELKGITDPSAPKEEVVSEAVHDFKEGRIAVLTMGNVGWSSSINKDEFPYMVVCRIREPIERNAVPIMSVIRGWYPFKDLEEAHVQFDNKREMLEKSSEASNKGHNQLEWSIVPSYANRVKNGLYGANKGMPTEAQSSSLITSENNFLYTEHGRQVQIYSTLQEDGVDAQGGEGKILITNIPRVVAKCYFDKPSTVQAQKIKQMIEYNLHIKGVCWPKAMLFNSSHEFVGYLMQQVPEGCYSLTSSVWQIKEPTLKEKLLPNWTRMDSAILCASIAKLFSKLHEQKVLMGDINPGNIMINPSNPYEVYFVDCDSYQFKTFHCPVGTPEFDSPSFIRRNGDGVGHNIKYGATSRTEAEENYSIAYLLFHIMMTVSPYYKVEENKILEAKLNHRFSFSYPMPSGVMTTVFYTMWVNMTKAVRDCFTNVFAREINVTPLDFEKCFTSYAYAMKKYNHPADIMPENFIDYSSDHSETIDLVCPLCGNKFNILSTSKNKERLKNGVPIYCRSCMAKLDAYSELPGTKQFKCAKCNKSFTPNLKQQVLYQHQQFKKIYCPNCMAIRQKERSK